MVSLEKSKFQIKAAEFPVTKEHWIYLCDDDQALPSALAHAYEQGQQALAQGLADGFNIGLNAGEAAGQDTSGIQLHLILRTYGDCKNPFGGVRKVVDGQADYTLEQYVHPHGIEIPQSVKDSWANDQALKFAMFYGPGDVPGYLTDQDMDVIQDICDRLPSHGKLVEIGSFLGKSASEWAKRLQTLGKSYDIYCIDSFNASRKSLVPVLKRSDFDVPDQPQDQLEFFLHYTKDHANIKAIKAFFDTNFTWQQGGVDCVFEDSDHREETLKHALPFWWQFINPGGIFCGHDYQMPQVRMCVDQFALSVGSQVEIKNNSIWIMAKNG